MKSIVYFFCLFLVSLQGFGQVNLVPNPSFEDYALCPNAFDQINRAVGWSSYSASPDYFNSCSISGNSVPSNTWGYQFAKHGNGYALVGTYDLQSLPFNSREYIGIELNHPLIFGRRYYVSAFVSRADSNYANGATNHLGFRFLENAYSSLAPFSPDNFAQVQCDSIILDQLNWVQVIGSFIADTAFGYLAIGNFYDNEHTDTIGFHGASAGYYIDAVCVSIDSVYTRNWTSVHENNIPEIQVAVNNDQVQILNMSNEELCIVYDLIGKEVYRETISSANNKIDFSMFAQSIYLIKVGNYASSKLLIFH